MIGIGGGGVGVGGGGGTSTVYGPEGLTGGGLGTGGSSMRKMLRPPASYLTLRLDSRMSRRNPVSGFSRPARPLPDAEDGAIGASWTLAADAEPKIWSLKLYRSRSIATASRMTIIINCFLFSAPTFIAAPIPSVPR